jgi:hypothetical protein
MASGFWSSIGLLPTKIGDNHAVERIGILSLRHSGASPPGSGVIMD